MNWNEFIERYLINHEEFRFKYKNYIIDLLYSGDGTKYVYYISEYIENETIFSKMKNRNKYLKFDKCDSPQELLEKFSINNKSFKEIWNELEWK